MKIARMLSLTVSWVAWSLITLFTVYTIYVTYTFDFGEPPRHKWFNLYTKTYILGILLMIVAVAVRVAYRGLLRLLRDSPKRSIIAFATLPVASLFVIGLSFIILSIGVEYVYYGSAFFWYFAFFPIAALITLGAHTPILLLPVNLRKPEQGAAANP
jgi:hypothetical protein